MKYILYLIFLMATMAGVRAQEGTLDFFLEQAKQHAPSLLEVENLQQVGQLQEEIIKAQNNAFQVDATSEIMVAPYFNSNGKFVDVTTNPSVQAIGYDVGITNGGLYSAQVNITKNIFNKAIVDRLVLQNQLANESLALTGEDLTKNMVKNLTDVYIMTYQSQLQRTFTGQLIKDLQTRLKVVEVLVKRGLLSEGDFLLVRSDIETRQLELEQIGINYSNLYAQLYNMAGVPLQVMDSLSEPVIRTETLKDSLLFERRYVNDSLQVMAAQEVFENQYRPQVSLYGNTGLNAVDLNNLQRRVGVSAGLKLTIPIYDGHQKNTIPCRTD
ncbi:TolC family protein [Flagellimonas lutimaris]|uniref:TolC family protein n=1 Tax=Flagellimonas lutimaris TaxID=475082 RepID=UPI003F5CD3A0